ncbi:hypothetical protein FRB96_006658 [Tulasnella sp. 330]|nr:hypothetical protein FRB96_006658 [Tulasnella sp. 330]
MAQSRNSKQKDDDFQLSQQSNEDDGVSQDAIIILMNQMKSDREKSRKKKETEFLKKAQAAYKQTLVAHSQSMVIALDEMQQAYEMWRVEEAASSDRIRSLWLAIAAESTRTKDIIDRLALLEDESKEQVELLSAEASKSRQQCLKGKHYSIL